jgi:Fe-S cluster assembly protein SufD
MFDIDYKPQAYAQVQNDALLAKREQAWQFLKENGLPTRHDEKWKYTNLNKWILNSQLTLTPVSVRKKLNRKDVQPYFTEGVLSLVFVDGQFENDLSDIAALPNGISIENVMESEVITHQNDYVKDHAKSLNDALFTSGVEINIAKGAVCASRIELLYISTENAEHHALCIQNVMNLSENSELKISEKQIVLFEDAPAYINIAYKVNLKEGAKLNWLMSTTNQQAKALITNSIDVQQAANSEFEYFNFIAQGDLNRYDFDIQLNDRGAMARLDGIFMLKGKMHSDNHIMVTHNASYTTSDVCFKGVATDKSNGIFNAKALVTKGIHAIKALQSNKNLLLKKTAQINTKPELEIYSDDVICSHGATIGQLDATAIFYMESRGIPHAAAVQMLTEGFVLEILDRQNISEPEKARLLDQLSHSITNLT